MRCPDSQRAGDEVNISSTLQRRSLPLKIRDEELCGIMGLNRCCAHWGVEFRSPVSRRRQRTCFIKHIHSAVVLQLLSWKILFSLQIQALIYRIMMQRSTGGTGPVSKSATVKTTAILTVKRCWVVNSKFPQYIWGKTVNLTFIVVKYCKCIILGSKKREIVL